MGKSDSVRWIGVLIVWGIVFSLVGAIVFKSIIKPGHNRQIEALTSGKSRYDHEITINLDSFSGYSILRSEAFKEELNAARIRLNIKDDNADYGQRIKELEAGKCQFAVFTVDSLIVSSVELGIWPGTIILGIDESHGADAVVAYKNSIPNLNSLNDPQARLVLTPNSPSEFMARIITAHFSLKSLAKNYVEPADGSTKVYEKFIKAGPADKKAYIMWEPDVSKALEQPGSHILLDSSKIKGHIVDVLVVQRKFLADHQDIVGKTVEAYLRAAYCYRNDMVELIIKDAKAGGGSLTRGQAEKIVKGILWKNSIENYAHFGLLDKSETKGIDHMEDIIQKITAVLVNTAAIESDPFYGNYNKLFYDKILEALKKNNFHPGRKINILADDIGLLDKEDMRGYIELPPLTDKQWQQLVPVGKMEINPVSFGRGKSTIGIQSRREIEDLAKKLRSWSSYYLVIVGHSRKEGDQELNRELARQRSQEVRNYLVNECGISSDRIKAKSAKVFTRAGEGQSVSFVVGQTPY
ncbi:MAG: phosphate ABC transporter substrate-binding/OmpA family protein [Candidatus Omnitrophica bacterium]|nr:phosphate ABC transporter substrate-binding/OmpA family protein [Candidatus Omnitrophota bacterium]